MHSETISPTELPSQLPKIMARFKVDGISALPIYIGEPGEPRAVLISPILFETLKTLLNDFIEQSKVLGRIKDNSPRISFEELVKAAGFDPADLD